ncbi:MAG: asparaginase [Anaerolineaceae bacterium]|nr:asparaginase [Anaerolineaceae bacterium]
MFYHSYQPLVEVTRGQTVESVHLGALAVVDARGNLLASCGDPGTVAFLRSSAKPFQALPLVESGAADAFGFDEREIAITCASHSGTDEHFAVIAAMQKKIGVSEADLLCGSHPPIFHPPTLRALIQRGEEATPNRHNCSGKHTGMLARARFENHPIEDYINPHHPVQAGNLQVFAEMTGMAVEQIATGTDGCSAPVFAVPLRNAALAYARLSQPDGLPTARAAACQRIFHAMTNHPDLIAGPGRFDTLLMQFAGGSILAKMGAEGYQGLGLLPGVLAPGSPGIGIAIKIADGDSADRAVATVAVETLRQLGALPSQAPVGLENFYPRPVFNWSKKVVGEIRPIFQLQRHG